jgi:hypothetical protein
MLHFTPVAYTCNPSLRGSSPVQTKSETPISAKKKKKAGCGGAPAISVMAGSIK